jgi:hypothetical protein
MKIKKFIIPALILTFSFVVASNVFAQTTSATTTATGAATKSLKFIDVNSFKPSEFNPPNIALENPIKEESSFNFDKQTNLSVIIKYGLSFINLRVNSLNNLKNQNINLKTITTEQTNKLNAIIDEQIAGLNVLAVKLKSDTDIETAKADAKSIFSNFRIYSVFMPKIRLIRNSDLVSNYLGIMLIFKGDSVSKNDPKQCGYILRQIALTDARKKITAANVKVIDTVIKINAILLADYPDAYKTELSSINSDLKDIKSQLDQIRNVIRNSNYFRVNTCTCDLDGNKICNEKDWNLFQVSWGRTDCIVKNRNNCKCDKNNDGKCDTSDWTMFSSDWGKILTCNKNKVCNIGENNVNCPSDCATSAACKSDFNQDGVVNSLDQAIFAADWARADCNIAGTAACECDLNKDGKCNLLDWTILGMDYGRIDCK